MSNRSSSYQFTRIFPIVVVCIPVFVFTMAVKPYFADTTTFTDTFDSSTYTKGEFNAADSGSNPDDISTSILNLFATGGNPGGRAVIEHLHDVDRDMGGDPINGDGFTNLQSFHTNDSFSYNPSVEGSIVDIRFSLDYRIDNPNVNSVFFGVSDINGGNFAAFSTPLASGQWETVTTGPLTQADFSSRDFGGSLDLGFELGFTSSLDVFGGPESIPIEVDNFVIIVNSVPEPGTAAFLLMGLLGIACRRRRT